MLYRPDQNRIFFCLRQYNKNCDNNQKIVMIWNANYVASKSRKLPNSHQEYILDDKFYLGEVPKDSISDPQ